MRFALTVLLLAGVAAGPVYAQARDDSLPGRVDKLEHQMRAVQRKVFPGGNPEYFEPQITPPAAAPEQVGNPAGSPIIDLTGRVSALEQQLQQMTNQVEENSHKLQMLQQAFDKMKGDTDYRLNALEGHGAPGGTGGAASAPPFGPAGRAPLPAGVTPANPSEDQGATDDLGPPPPKAKPADQTPPAPSTGDPAEDAYMAGYRLWVDKRYPDAEAQLKKVVEKYPDSRRASFAQNLLGRAYLDDGQYASAAEAFLKSYRKFPRGERAPDSLYYLGQTLVKLNKPKQACQAWGEFDDVYGANANATLKAKVAKGRADAKCDG
ncbi:MAG TPA: tetratricopeptide repeat protein [Sphingomonas sp.]|nr:tetratricopeptide repeat protein [Sphingomonas sp.]